MKVILKKLECSKTYIFLLISFSINFIYTNPPSRIPAEFYDAFTMNNSIPVKYEYYDNTYLSYYNLTYTKIMIDDFILGISERSISNYGLTDIFLYDAIEKYLPHIKNKKTAIMGSTSPFYECTVLYYEGEPITIDYNKIISEDSRLKTMTVEEFNKNPIFFDSVISISSYEHDGLGRYGDPINPSGDIEAMKNTKKFLKKDGLFFLAVPVGKDSLLWNGCRIYGRKRLPLLLEGWEIVDSFGFSEEDFDREEFNWYHQPVFVLRPIEKN